MGSPLLDLKPLPDEEVPEKSPNTPDANPHPKLGALPQIPAHLTGTRKLSIIHRNEAKNFALEVVRSEEYKQSIWDRIRTHTLSPQMEKELWDRAYGKTVERMEVRATQESLANLSSEELARRAELVVALLKAKQALESEERVLEGEIVR